jgi:hypothetical protein
MDVWMDKQTEKWKAGSKPLFGKETQGDDLVAVESFGPLCLEGLRVSDAAEW